MHFYPPYFAPPSAQIFTTLRLHSAHSLAIALSDWTTLENLRKCVTLLTTCATLRKTLAQHCATLESLRKCVVPYSQPAHQRKTQPLHLKTSYLDLLPGVFVNTPACQHKLTHAWGSFAFARGYGIPATYAIAMHIRGW